MRKPWEHQKSGLVWAGDRHKVALFWEMRLGKNLVVIRWATQWNTITLVICPNDVIETWLEEFVLEGITATHLQGFSIEVPAHGHWFICSYETYRGNPFLQSFSFGCVILDESTVIKNPKAQITKAVLRQNKRTPHKAILTGVPAPEDPLLDYATQMLFLYGKFLGCSNYWAIRATHFEPTGFGWTPKGGVAPRAIQEIGNKVSVLTRSQVNMGGVLVQERRRIQMPNELRSVYDNAENLFELQGQETNWRPVVQTWLARLAGGCHPACPSPHKLDAFQSLLRELKGQQIVVWFNFLSEIDAVAALLNKTDIDYGVISGDVPTPERARLNTYFQRGQLQLLLCQVRCARFGRNFSAAEASVYFSLPWDLLSYLQSRDRVIHLEKTTPTLSLQLITRDSVDEDVLLALMTKRNVSLTFKALVGQNLCERKGKR